MNLFSLFTPSVESAVRNLEKAVDRLDRARQHHALKAEALTYAAEQAAAAAAVQNAAADRAYRIGNKLTDLLA